FNGTNRVASTVGRGWFATATASWTFTGLDTSKTYDVYVTFAGRSGDSPTAPFTVYDGSTSRGTQLINETILITQSQGGRAQGFYGGVGWLELGHYANSSGTLKVSLGNLTGGNFVDADGVLLVSLGASAPSRAKGTNALRVLYDSGQQPSAGVPM